MGGGRCQNISVLSGKTIQLTRFFSVEWNNNDKHFWQCSKNIPSNLLWVIFERIHEHLKVTLHNRWVKYTIWKSVLPQVWLQNQPVYYITSKPLPIVQSLRHTIKKDSHNKSCIKSLLHVSIHFLSIYQLNINCLNFLTLTLTLTWLATVVGMLSETRALNTHPDHRKGYPSPTGTNIH